MSRRERTVFLGLGVAFALVTALFASILPWGRDLDIPVTVGLVVLYAIASRVEFEIGSGWAVASQLVFVPMLFLIPLPLIPVLVAVGYLLADAPDFVQRRKHPDRSLSSLTDAWFAAGPVLTLGLLAPGAPKAGMIGVYALAFAAQVAAGLVTAIVREHLCYGVPFRETVRSAAWSYRIDAALSPIAYVAAIVAYGSPATVLVLVPLLWLLVEFSRERRARYSASLELNQAYRGTVMLLSDVIESDDGYTAEHSRSVVELVTAVAHELSLDSAARHELEFAAMLHDVGKITIPKEILNKPSKLTDEEFELIKTHTVEGQIMLDRVGGLLARVGRIVRSSHERWDGKGYPDGLAERQIPLAARIVFCCDAYNAMTTDRPYRRAMTREEAVAELRDNAGTQFDPYVVSALVKVVDELQPARIPPVDAVRAVFATRELTSPVEATG